MKYLIFAFVFIFSSNFIFSQNAPSPVLFIYDASGSMWGKIDQKTKKEIASTVLTTTVQTLPENQKLGLIVYGHRQKDNCDDIEMVVDLSNGQKKDIGPALKNINPTGKTPLARSATRAFDYLQNKKSKATIILITDGIESCDGDLCDVVKKAVKSGIEFKLHIVGFGLKEEESKTLKCAAQAGNGRYYDAADSDGLADVLTEATQKTVDKPKENFSVYAVKNGKAVDAWVRPREVASKKEINSSRTYRDTAKIYLPPGKYTVDVKALENTDIPGTTMTVEIKEGQTIHKDVSFDAGTIEVFTSNNGEPWDGMVKVLDKTTGKVVANTRTYGKKQKMEVPAGNYKLTFTALVIEGTATHFEMEDVEIKSNATTQQSHDFHSGIAMIGVSTTAGELIDATVNFYEVGSGKSVAAARTYTSKTSNPKKFILSPGEYEVRIQTLGNHKGHKDTQKVTVKKGETVERLLIF